MLPIKKVTIFNTMINFAIVGMTAIDLQAGLLLVVLLFGYEHGSDIIHRDFKLKKHM